jgi:hypothetical protein
VSLAAAPGALNSPDKKQDADAEKPDGGKFEPFKPESTASTGTVTIGGQAISYQAIAGTFIVHPKDWDDVARDPKADKGSAPAEEGATPATWSTPRTHRSSCCTTMWRGSFAAPVTPAIELIHPPHTKTRSIPPVLASLTY